MQHIVINMRSTYRMGLCRKPGSLDGAEQRHDASGVAKQPGHSHLVLRHIC